MAFCFQKEQSKKGGRFEPIKTSVGEQHLYMFIDLANDIMIIIRLFE